MLAFPDAIAALRAAYSVPHGPKVSPPRVVTRGDGNWLRALAASPPGLALHGREGVRLRAGEIGELSDRAVRAGDRRARRTGRCQPHHGVPHRRDLGGRRRSPGAARRRNPRRARQRARGADACPCHRGRAPARAAARVQSDRRQPRGLRPPVLRRARDPVRLPCRPRRMPSKAPASCSPPRARTTRARSCSGAGCATACSSCRSARPCRSSARSTSTWFPPAT